MQGAQLGHPLSVLLGHTGPVTFIEFCRTVHYALVSSSYDGTCRLWNATTSGPALHVLPISATFGPMHGVTRFGGGSQPSGLAVPMVQWPRQEQGCSQAQELYRVQQLAKHCESSLW